MHRLSDQTESPIVVGRFSRRPLLGAFASIPAIAGATAAMPATPLPSLDDLTPAEIAQRDADKLAATLQDMHGGDWRVTVDHSHGFALIVQHRKAS